MTTYREEEDLFEEDIVFDQAGLLNNSEKMSTAIRRISSGKCALFAKTLGLCGAFFGLGLCIAIPGPTFLSPVLTLQADMSPISTIYAARSSGYLIGSILGGFLFDHFNRLFLLFISLLLTSIFITVVPWCQVFWLLEACMIVLGISMGFLDTGGNVLCLDLWGRNSGPFMQALHFSFGLGAFVAPLLAAPFLEPKFITNTTTNSLIAKTNHEINLNEMHAFQTDSVARLRRDISNITYFQHVNAILQDNITKNFTDVQDLSDKISPLGSSMKNPVIFLNSTLVADMTSTLTPSLKTTQRSPKPKPSKIDGRKLGNENWDRVPVRKPPIADLMPLTTLPLTTTVQTSTSQVPSTTISTASTLSDSLESKTYVQELASTSTSTTFRAEFTSEVGHNSKHETNVSILQPVESKSISSQIISGGNALLSSTPLPTILENVIQRNISTFLPNLPSYSTGRGQIIEGGLFQPTASEAQSPFKIDKLENSQSDMEMTRESDDDSDYSLNDLSQNPEMSDGENQLVTPSTNVNEKSLFEEYGDSFDSSVNRMSIVSTTTVDTVKHIHHYKPGTYDNDTEEIDTIFNVFASKIEKYGLSKVQFTYLIVGLFIFLVSLVFLGFICHNPRDPKSKQEEGQGTKVTKKALSNTLVILMAIFLLLFIGLELTFGQLVVVFAIHSDLQLTEATGTTIAAAFWGSFAAMRFASIFFASGLSPMRMLIFNFVLCTTGTIVLSALGNTTESALWAGTVIVGIGLASIFPTSILWMERYIHVSNKVAAMLVVGVSLGEMICPIIIYRLMIINPSMLMHVSLVINFLCILIFLIMWWLASRLGEKYCVVNNNGYQLANQNEEEEDMMDMSPSDGRLSLRRYSLSAERRSLLNGSLH